MCGASRSGADPGLREGQHGRADPVPGDLPRHRLAGQGAAVELDARLGRSRRRRWACGACRSRTAPADARSRRARRGRLQPSRTVSAAGADHLGIGGVAIAFGRDAVDRLEAQPFQPRQAAPGARSAATYPAISQRASGSLSVRQRLPGGARLLRRFQQHQRMAAAMRGEHDAEEAGQRGEGAVRVGLQRDAADSRPTIRPPRGTASSRPW